MSLECVCYPLLLLRACSSAPPSNFKLRKVSCFIKLALSPRKHIPRVVSGRRQDTQIVNIPYSTSVLQARIHATVLSAHSPPHCAGHQPFLGD
ncbi:hypothetical protein C8J57DRAFT_1280874 [Mycena rebaudengoi]|nr:hypothetical protein C8J57DRAFT_1386818 [Mycena rebaudengoi]KAJ7245447.1 hypothetical protein C8J57DRAFT_1361925 [Mycena rebaudengoi]KAJ7255281.1 hypothetical protein C8J57DRAFT_1345967 [Mycena rebaudengoi]KAJ7270555.1 hypothetical protein C8J57DRAFT_1322047 [Mycena rebaudengoi]KAJ7272473.1 hypothetical protein C8J57DRAFT_1318881 [Mycena rebaudengoi]